MGKLENTTNYQESVGLARLTWQMMTNLARKRVYSQVGVVLRGRVMGLEIILLCRKALLRDLMKRKKHVILLIGLSILIGKSASTPEIAQPL
jgi:hypothetical protein